MSILQRILPAVVDNHYRGQALGLWLLALIALQKVGVSLTHVFKADGGAQSISTMPLDTYPSSASQNIVGLMARMGLEQLLLAALLVLVLLRYRALIPLMYVLLIVHYLAGRAVVRMKPLVLAGTSGVSTMALIIAILSVLGLALSLTGRGDPEPAGP
jgi:hypothetical protein